MVKEIVRNMAKYYVCDDCGLVYKEKSWAEKCQAFCIRHNACSIEITKHAIQLK